MTNLTIVHLPNMAGVLDTRCLLPCTFAVVPAPSTKQQSSCCLLCMPQGQSNQPLNGADRCGMDELQCSPETGPQTYDAPLCYQQASCEKVCECVPTDIRPLVCYSGKNLVLALHRLASCSDNAYSPCPVICLVSLSCTKQVTEAGDNTSR